MTEIFSEERFPSPPFELLHVEVRVDQEEESEISDEPEDVILKRGVNWLEPLWPVLWPDIYENLWKTVIYYKRDKTLILGKVILSISLPLDHTAEGCEWGISIAADPMDGAFCVDLEGTKIIDTGVAF